MIKKLACFLVLIFCVSCTKEKVSFTPDKLQEYLNLNAGLITDEVIACAASDEFDASISYVFYYPVPSATEILYYETEDTNVNPNDFTQYKLRVLPKEGVFNGNLEPSYITDVKPLSIPSLHS